MIADKIPLLNEPTQPLEEFYRSRFTKLQILATSYQSPEMAVITAP